jgi:hypothetical protein
MVIFGIAGGIAEEERACEKLLEPLVVVTIGSLFARERRKLGSLSEH